MTVRIGIDRILDRELTIEGRRFGLLTNDAAVSSDSPDVPARARLVRFFSDEGASSIVRVFSPEHGIGAIEADGSAVADVTDTLTDLPVISLYGERFAPPAEALADLDAVLFDVPDAGARFYTYVWTLTHLIDACADAGVRVVVLDRPNPRSGKLSRAEGPILDLACCASFLGRLDIPITHGLTLGELALLWKAERRPEAQVEVVPVARWRRAMNWRETGLPFVPPSPALCTPNAVAMYPGLCLFEGFNVSVGRGSALSFEAIGAPWMDAEAVLNAVPDASLTGVEVDGTRFTPSICPYGDRICHGLRFQVIDHEIVRPVQLGMHLLRAVAGVHGTDLMGAPYPTVANPSGEGHLELLLGRKDVADRIRSATEGEILAWTSCDGWQVRVAEHLIYG
jgi:uncharacterized protein YbbC (DUF1343 family)